MIFETKNKYGKITVMVGDAYDNIKVYASGMKRDVEVPFRGKTAWVTRHTVNIIFNGEKAQFQYSTSIADYQAGKDKLSKEDLVYALRSFLEDGLYAEEGFEDFCNELGYDVWADDPDEADRETGYDKKSLKVYKACERSRAKAERIGIDVDMTYDIINEIREAGYE